MWTPRVRGEATMLGLERNRQKQLNNLYKRVQSTRSNVRKKKIKCKRKKKESQYHQWISNRMVWKLDVPSSEQRHRRHQTKSKINEEFELT